MLQQEHMKKPPDHLFSMTTNMVFLRSCLKKPINVVFKQVNALLGKCFTRLLQKHLLVSNNFHH